MHSELYFLQFSYVLYRQETLLLGLQNLLLQPACKWCNAQHRDSKWRQTQACWKVETFYKQPLYYSRGLSYAAGLVIIIIYWRKKLPGRQRGACPPAPGWIRHCLHVEIARRKKWARICIFRPADPHSPLGAWWWWLSLSINSLPVTRRY